MAFDRELVLPQRAHAAACQQPRVKAALEYATSRIQFAGQPIASHQLVQNKLAWMVTEITKAQLLAEHLGRMKDKGTIKPEHISMGKMNNCNIALECARIARDILGANGISDDFFVKSNHLTFNWMSVWRRGADYR